MSEIKYTPTIDGNVSLFYYKNNILDKEDYDELNRFLTSSNYKDGFCISGKEIPSIVVSKQQHYFCDVESKI